MTPAEELRAAADRLALRPCDDVERATANLLAQIALLIDCPPVEYLDEFNIPAFPDHRVVQPALRLARAINGEVAA